MTIIKDGTGTRNAVNVTANNRLSTNSVTITLEQQATENGDAYNTSTGTLTLTSSCESSLFYLKNNENQDVIICSIFVAAKDVTGCLTSQPELRILKNPNAGTVVSCATIAGSVSNRNYGSSKTLCADIYQGTEGKTLTGENGCVTVFLPSLAAVTFLEFDTTVVLPKGATIGIAYTPPAGLTSMKIRAGVTLILNNNLI